MEIEEKGVIEPLDGGVVSPAANTSEDVSSQEVKIDQQEVDKSVDVAKLQTQINNLNIALKQERETRKPDSEKMKEMSEKLEKANETISRLSEVFNPRQPAVDEDVSTQYVAENQLEEFWAKKEAERELANKKKEIDNSIQSEIKEMEKVWDGSNGKPKYDDDAVINWQKENGKLNLTPKAAFYVMKHDEIVDYEVKQRLAKKPVVENVERPSGNTAIREPQVLSLKTESETRQAVSEAIDNAMAENNN